MLILKYLYFLLVHFNSFSIKNCFLGSLINAKQKLWGAPHLLHMCVIFFISNTYITSAKQRGWHESIKFLHGSKSWRWSKTNLFFFAKGEDGEKALEKLKHVIKIWPKRGHTFENKLRNTWTAILKILNMIMLGLSCFIM